MPAKGVLVTSHDRSGYFISRSSAVFFDNLILLQGNHLAPLLQQQKWKEIFNSIHPSIDQNTEACAFIDENIGFDVFEEADDENVLPGTVERVGRRYVTAAAWRCPLVGESLEVFQTADDSESDVSCLSVFLLLKIPGDGFAVDHRIPRWIHHLGMALRGTGVIVESTPAGMQAFINSWSHGVVARLFGRRRCLFLTDAVVHSECTGAPVYISVRSRFDTIKKGSLVGMVLGTSDNFTCGIALLPVLSLIIPTATLPPRVTPPQSGVRKLVDETVGAIFSGNLQGSGVIVDSRHGIVLTCSHVIQNDAKTVKMYLKNDVFTCDVVRCLRGSDLAVLKASPKSFLREHMEIAEYPARIGDIVCMAGFPHVLPFDQTDIQPFITFGYISKSLPHAIVCNCSVTKGNSGGAIIRNKKLLGLVSFVKSGQSGFGFILPAAVFRDNIQKYIETSDVAHLKKLESLEVVQRFWNVDHSKL